MSSFPISITWQVQTPPTASFEQLAKSAQSLDQAMAASAGNFDKFGQTVSQLESPLSGVSGSMGELEGSMSGLEGSLGSAAGSMGEFAGSTEQLNGAIGETGGFVTEASGSMSELSGTTGETGTAMTDLSGTTQEFNGSISETGGFVQETGTTMGELNTTTGETNTAFGELNPLVTETNTGFAELSPVVTETGTGMTDLTTATDDTNTALETSVDALGNVVPGLQDTATGAADSAQGFSDLAPPIEDTNTALDSSSGLLEGVSPLLGSTGENAGIAATETGEFSGALGGLNTELGPVNGGLDSSNLLMEDLTESTGTTKGETDKLSGSMGTLGLGITGAIGSAISLVTSFTNLRNAGFKVEAAQVALDKANTKVERSFVAVGKSINKILTDQENNYQGTTRLAKAYGDLAKLIDAGVTSGPKFSAALDELKAAQDGVTSSTFAGQQQLRTLNAQIDTLGQSSDTAAIKQNNLTKQIENQIFQYAGLGGSLATVITMFTSLGTILKGAASVAGTMTAAAVLTKGAFIDLAIVGSQVLIPALAGIAVPVGIAIGALAAFAAAVTAIRANIGVFDELGVKVGEVFPEMKGFLDTGRQAFINFSDGMNTAISLLLGGLDSLTGGVTKFQQDWDKFTGSLPKGTGELGKVGLSAEMVANQLGLTNTALKVGADKWKVIDGELRRTNGSLLATAGNWDVLADGTAIFIPIADKAAASTAEVTTAMDAMGPSVGAVGFVLKDQSANYSELTNAQKFNVAAGNSVIESLATEREERARAVAEAQFYLGTIEGITPAVGLSGAAIVGMSNALRGQTTEHFKAVSAASEYIQKVDAEYLTVYRTDAAILAHAASLKEQEKATGKATEATAKHVEELNKLQTTLQENAAELVFYADAGNRANRMQSEFSIGVQEAQLKLNDQEAALARNNGTLQGNLQLLQEGRLQEVAYAEGVYEANNAIVTKTQALSKALGSYQTTNDLMDEGTILVLAMAKGWLDAQIAIQKNTEALNEQIGALASWTDEATRVQAQQNAALKGWLDQKKAVQDAELAYFEAAGKLKGLEQGFGDAYQAMLRLNTGVLTGAANAIEWYQEIETARGEAGGFKSVLVGLASQLGTIPDAFSQSAEQLQRFIGVMRGAPDAIQSVIDGIGEMADTIVQRLAEAGEEGADAFMENLEALEDELRTQFSEPVVRVLQLQVDMANAEKQAQAALGTMAAIIEGSMIPGPTIEWDTATIQAGAREIMAGLEQTMAEGGPRVAAGLQPVHDVLQKIATTDFNTAPISTVGGILADMLTSSENLTQSGLQPLLGMLSQVPSVSAAGAEGFAALDAAIAHTGFSVDATGQIINDTTGEIIGKIGELPGATQDPLTQLANSILGTGTAAMNAKVQWATEIAAMKNLIAQFVIDSTSLLIGNLTSWTGWAIGVNLQLVRAGQAANTFASAFMSAFARDIQTHLTTAGNHFNTFAQQVTQGVFKAGQAANTFASALMSAFARDVQTHLTKAQTAFATFASQVTSRLTSTRSAITTFQSAVTTMASQGASRVSSFASSFQSAMSRVQSSANSARSSVQQLQSAINSLKSKTVVITTIHRQVIQRVYAAQGGAFVASSPTKVGPLNVSEFGQRELITVTPLENPGGQTITGPGMQVSTSGPNAKAFAKSGTESISLGGGGNEGDARDLVKKIADFLEEKISSSKRAESGKRVIKVEQPQIIALNLEGKQLLKYINKNLFEISDSILS